MGEQQAKDQDYSLNDREITLALAKNVMEWKTESTHGGKRMLAFDSAGHTHCLWTHLRSDSVAPLLWNPLESITDAWTVLDKLVKSGCMYEVGTRGGPDLQVHPTERYACVCHPDVYDEDGAPWEKADSVCRAICLAALKVELP